MEAKKEEKKPETKAVAVVEKNITDSVLVQVNALKNSGALRIPADYSPENALKSAFLVLQEVVDKDKKQALTVCTKESSALALLDMVVRGLNPMKKQCYFIVYGSKLTMQPSYFGNMATAKRCGMKDVNAEIVYEGDVLKYKVDEKTGRKELVSHEQDIANIDIKKIKGAYAITIMEDGTTNLTIMTIVQIRQAWLQGATKGNSGAHTNFTDEMAKRTVINRACKQIINTSDDAYLFEPTEEVGEEQQPPENLNFHEAEVVGEKQSDKKESENTDQKQAVPGTQNEMGF